MKIKKVTIYTKGSKMAKCINVFPIFLGILLVFTSVFTLQVLSQYETLPIEVHNVFFNPNQYKSFYNPENIVHFDSNNVFDVSHDERDELHMINLHLNNKLIFTLNFKSSSPVSAELFYFSIESGIDQALKTKIVSVYHSGISEKLIFSGQKIFIPKLIDADAVDGNIHQAVLTYINLFFDYLKELINQQKSLFFSNYVLLYAQNPSLKVKTLYSKELFNFMERNVFQYVFSPKTLTLIDTTTPKNDESGETQVESKMKMNSFFSGSEVFSMCAPSEKGIQKVNFQHEKYLQIVNNHILNEIFNKDIEYEVYCEVVMNALIALRYKNNYTYLGIFKEFVEIFKKNVQQNLKKYSKEKRKRLTEIYNMCQKVEANLDIKEKEKLKLK